MKFRIATAALVVVGVCSLQMLVAQQPKSSWDGIYSDTQAKRAEPLYQENCVGCHGKDFMGTKAGPPIAGAPLLSKWQNKPVRDLFEYVHTKMPYNSPGGLTRAQNADIVALLLRQSKVPAGPKDFTPPAFEGEGEGSPARGLAFYTEEQAARGRITFDRNCGRCHTTAKSTQTLEQVNKAGLPGSFAAPFLQRNYYGKTLYPSVYYLYSKTQSMPAFDTHSVTQQQRADIIAHILKANGFPAGRDELRPDPEAMKQMMLNEPGFQRIFNGKDFTGIKFNVGPNCQPAPNGCGKTEPSGVIRVGENGTMVCECNIHSYWYTETKYRNFDLRFQHRFVKPADWTSADDDELYFGGGGFLLFIHDNYSVWPKSIEVEGRWHDMFDIFFIGGKEGKFTYDHDAKVRAQRSPWEWNDVRIVSKDGRVDSYMNGQLISTITEHDDYPEGHIGFQMEGSPTEWRNLRIKVE